MTPRRVPFPSRCGRWSRRSDRVDMNLLYLAALAIALTGMVVLDRRFGLFFWRDARRAAIVLIVGVLFFFAWDLAGVGLGIFFRGRDGVHDGSAGRARSAARGDLLSHAALLPDDERVRLRHPRIEPVEISPARYMTYWALNAIFLAIVVVLAVLARRRLSWPAVGITVAVLLVMTAVFDNIMISVGLVAYEPSLISGAFVGIAPLEDFAYALAAIVGLPSLWVLLPPAGRAKSRPPRA